MSVNRICYSFFLLYVFHSVHQVISKEFVPVYLWETAKNVEVVPSLPRINKGTFKEILQEKLEKDPFVIVFAEPSLSPEDFNEIEASDKKPFPHLTQIKFSAKTTYLPSVEDPISVVKELYKTEIPRVSLKTFSNVPIQSRSAPLIVELNDVQDSETRIDMLNRHDSSIVSIYNQLLKEHKNVLALFTAYHTSWIIPEEININRQIRSILQVKEGEVVETDERKLYGTENFLLYVNSSATLSNGKKIFSLSEHTVTSAFTDNRTFLVDLKPPATSENNVDVQLTITFENGYWNLYTISVTDHTEKDLVFELRSKGISAPRQFSYQCTSQIFYGVNNTDRNLSLPGFQMQPFQTVLVNKTFGDAYFCVGFTTVPIWSGLFVTSILVIIMAIGLSMMMDIKTMDRFDDPKGKTIIINASE